MNRRHFLRSSAFAGAGLASVSAESLRSEPGAQKEGRAEWVAMLTRVARPVIANLASNQLKAKMPVEAVKGRVEDRRAVTHLEALSRTLAGIAPWLGVAGGAAEEEKVRADFASMTRQALANAVDPAAP